MEKSSWQQIELTCEAQYTERLSDFLSHLDALSVTIEGAHSDEILFEPHPGSKPLWRLNKIIALFEATTDGDAILRRLQQAFPATILQSLQLSTLQEEDWERRWMENYRPIQITDKLWICPSWHQAPDKDAINIFLDPGLAFGTGTHPTTAMCLRWIEQTITPNSTLIDFGCGSGILAICAIKLGCKQVFAMDIDPKALEVTRDNASKNGITEEQLITLLAPKQTPPSADFVVANILADPLIQLAPVITNLVRPQGKIALSGLLQNQAAAVQLAYQSHFNMTIWDDNDNWVCLNGISR